MSKEPNSPSTRREKEAEKEHIFRLQKLKEEQELENKIRKKNKK